MIYFNCDYSEGCHPAILEAMARTNMEQLPGYGEDVHCAHAAELIKEACRAPDAAVHFLVGGTQTNMLFISVALRPHQAVLCADSGHINVHEVGAVEATGHKVIGLAAIDGKLFAPQVKAAARDYKDDPTHEHMAQPKLVYISNPTEYGTLYSKTELEALRAVCLEEGLYLYVDGARLGYGLVSPQNDLTLADYARLTDAFYIGGTKVGAMIGEALVISNKAFNEDFRSLEKQRGAMLAKGRFIGLQFETLFTDGLYEKISRGAVEKALKIRDACAAKGWEFLMDSPTNQQYVIIPVETLCRLEGKYVFSPSGAVTGQSICVRICTSWATTDEDTEELINDIANA